MQDRRVYTILHLISRLPVGGVENMLLKVVKGYDKGRFRVVVCCMKEGGPVADELARAGFRVEVLGLKKKGFDWRAVIAIYRFIKKEKIDILRTHQFHANLHGRIAGVLARVPVIIPSFHNLYVSPDIPKLHRRIANNVLARLSDALVAVSRSVADDVARFDRVSPGRLTVIHNGVATGDFRPGIAKEAAREPFGLPGDRIITGTVGRLTEQKGHRFLIEAVSGMDGVSLAFAGDGPMMGELKGLARRLGVDCVFLGRVEPSRIPAFLKALDIYCFPSLWEGMPSALVEAMAAGLPVVATDIPPHREVLDGAGILVPPENAPGLRNALGRLAGDPGKREALGKVASERAAVFSIENTVAAYEALYESCLERKGLI